MLASNKNAIFATVLAAMLVLPGCARKSSEDLRAEALQYQQKHEFPAAIIILKNALAQDARDGSTRMQLARVYIDSGDILAAEKESRTALDYGFSEDAALPVLGKALLMQSKFQKVLDETAAASARGGAEILSLRGDAFMALGKNDEARALYDKVLQARPAFGAALIGRGRLAYLERDSGKAMALADQAIAAEPANTDALLFKGDLQRAQGQHDAALATYQQVLKINPVHRSAHVEKAYLLISMGKFQPAQAELDAAMAITPGAVLVHYTQALLDFSQGKYAAANESMLKVLKVAPDHMPSLLLAGSIDLSLGSNHQAEHHLRQYLEKNPDNVFARKMLATALLRTGHTPDALTVLEPALKVTRQDPQLLAMIGGTYMQARDFSKAGDFFEEASKLDPNAASLRTSLAMSKLGRGEHVQAISDLQMATRLDAKSQHAGMTLVKTQLSLGQVDKAHESLLALEKAQPDNAAVQDLKGLVYLGKQDRAQARASFARALALQPSYFPAAANLAQIDVGAGDVAAARKQVLAFLEKNKTSIEAMNAMSSLAARENKVEEATSWLERASAVDPAAFSPAVNLLAQYLLAGQNLKALDLARKLHVTHSGNPDLLDLLGKAQLANGDRDGALATYRKLAVELPRSPHIQMQVAALYMLNDNAASAEDYLKTALAIQPDFPAAQLAQAELYVRKGSHELALMVAGHIKKNHPKASAGYQLEGDILMGQKKYALALPAYEKALALTRSNELTIKLAHALRESGKPQEADKRLEQWMAQNPKDLRVPMYKAETLLAAGQYKEGAARLEAVLLLQPRHVVALNNLALAYQLGKDARAKTVAEQAFKLAKDNPAIMDTLGWILVEQGESARGVALLRQASSMAPKARDIRYHLAVALLKSGDKQGARRELDVLVAGNLQFAQAQEALALHKQLQ
ncbi:MAG: XrtA/PEP-CTERM system TPR-repeat protein PrsT [Pseudomonadota bacterium]